jgi:hypothetical protein
MGGIELLWKKIVNSNPLPRALGVLALGSCLEFYAVFSVWAIFQPDGDAVRPALMVAAVVPVWFLVSQVVRKIRESLTGHGSSPTIERVDRDVSWARDRATQVLRTLVPHRELKLNREQFAISAYPPMSWETWGEKITVVVRPDGQGSVVEVSSYCYIPQLFDWGKNRRNVESILRRITGG